MIHFQLQFTFAHDLVPTFLLLLQKLYNTKYFFFIWKIDTYYYNYMHPISTYANTTCLALDPGNKCQKNFFFLAETPNSTYT